jgi:hypothetical protein
MAEVLNQVFPEGIVNHIAELIPRDPEIEWETVFGSTVIYKTKHMITYGGGPEGGYVYFFREREAGWYSWRRDWFQPPVYTKVEGQVAIWWDDGVERIGVVPHDYEPPEDEEIIICSDEWSEMISDE